MIIVIIIMIIIIRNYQNDNLMLLDDECVVLKIMRWETTSDERMVNELEKCWVPTKLWIVCSVFYVYVVFWES